MGLRHVFADRIADPRLPDPCDFPRPLPLAAPAPLFVVPPRFCVTVAALFLGFFRDFSNKPVSGRAIIAARSSTVIGVTVVMMICRHHTSASQLLKRVQMIF